ncbi:hypothetical protein BN2476_1210011 [Paraburkholderia piptadeniae]|uniref:Uncharacterized protein n=1 Tax=Paraburkholderia piptadeniae TaxID=1701573 RepID=A0A1N7SVD9_9BURK|nr:hypothetical protein BN2476_1210011 [Paraburkholderia piptadeniae]
MYRRIAARHPARRAAPPCCGAIACVACFLEQPLLQTAKALGLPGGHMRLSILINTSDPTVNHDYAVLWLDTLNHAWTSHDRRGVELPSSGEMREDGHVVSLCARHGRATRDAVRRARRPARQHDVGARPGDVDLALVRRSRCGLLALAGRRARGFALDASLALARACWIVRPSNTNTVD